MEIILPDQTSQPDLDAVSGNQLLMWAASEAADTGLIHPPAVPVVISLRGRWWLVNITFIDVDANVVQELLE